MIDTFPYLSSSIAAVAKGLYLQHGFDPDIAYLAVWYSRRGDDPVPGWSRMFSSLDKAKNIPRIDEESAERFLAVYTQRKSQ